MLIRRYTAYTPDYNPAYILTNSLNDDVLKKKSDAWIGWVSRSSTSTDFKSRLRLFLLHINCGNLSSKQSQKLKNYRLTQVMTDDTTDEHWAEKSDSVLSAVLNNLLLQGDRKQLVY